MNRLYISLIIAVGSICLSACSSNNNSTSDQSTEETSTLNWQNCADQSPLQCATLEVLTDPGDVESEALVLALNRLPSIKSEREGIVLLNPGGPGGSGIELLEELSDADTLPPALREKFDFIGFDPRGVGASAAVDCSEFGTTEINTYLANHQAIDEFIENQISVATSCGEKYGIYLQQLGSQNVVHDMDAIRKATGEEKMHYLGYSYGTRLGALYLQTYPENSGHFVLDGSVNPAPDVQILLVGAIEAMQASLVALFEECGAFNSNCSGTLLMEQLENRIAQLVNDGRQEEWEIVAVTAYFAAENPEAGPFLLQPLYDYLQTGDLTELKDIYDGGLSEALLDGDDTAERAVMCADDATRPTANELKNRLLEYNQLSDFFAEIHLSQSGMCSGWPVSLSALPTIASNQAPPALVIGGTTDTLTLARWSEEMAQSIGGYYLESEHLGHTSVFNGQSECVDAIAEAFLLNGLHPVASKCLRE